MRVHNAPSGWEDGPWTLDEAHFLLRKELGSVWTVRKWKKAVWEREEKTFNFLKIFYYLIGKQEKKISFSLSFMFTNHKAQLPPCDVFDYFEWAATSSHRETSMVASPCLTVLIMLGNKHIHLDEEGDNRHLSEAWEPNKDRAMRNQEKLDSRAPPFTPKTLFSLCTTEFHQILELPRPPILRFVSFNWTIASTTPIV